MKKHIIEEPDDESLAAYLPLKNHIKRLEVIMQLYIRKCSQG